MSDEAWELIFLMFVLKLPIVYLVAVVVYAIRANPDAEPVRTPVVADDPEPGPCLWRAERRRARRPDRPRGHATVRARR